MTIESAKARTACLVRRHNDNRSMPHNLQIGWCHVGRVAELQRFIDTAWRPDHILAHDQGLLRWQYRFPGKPQELSILVAEEAGQIIGMLGAIQVGFSDRGKRHPGVMLALWIVKEEYRERAVGLRLYQRLMDGQCAFIGVLGINEEVARIYRAMRYAMWERIPRWAHAFSKADLARLLAQHGEEYSQPAIDAWLATADGAPLPSVRGVRIVGCHAGNVAAWNDAWRDKFAPLCAASGATRITCNGDIWIILDMTIRSSSLRTRPTAKSSASSCIEWPRSEIAPSACSASSNSLANSGQLKHWRATPAKRR